MPRLSRIGAASSGSFGFGTVARPGAIAIDYLLAGGGGTGGSGISPGGGGAGQIIRSTGNILTTETYTVVVGAVSGASTFNTITASAGGSGSGANGGASAAGFGGGNGNSVYFPPTGAPWTAGGDGYAGGGGGGAAGAGGGGAARNTPDYFAQGGNGGTGVVWSIDSVTYGIGGGGTAVAISNTDGVQPVSANGSGGSTFGCGGQNGGAIITYISDTQLFTGGTVTSSGSSPNIRWKHTFSSSSNLVPLV